MGRIDLIRMVLVGIVAGWVGALFTSVQLGAQPPQESREAMVVTAEELRLVGKDGKLRALLSTQPDGAASLAFSDRQGKVRAEIGMNAAGVSEVALYDQEGKQKKPHAFAYMFQLPNGGPRLSLIGDAANLTIASDRLAGYATLKIEPGDIPVLSLEGEGKGAALLTMLQNGMPSLTLYDPEGYRRAALEIKETQARGQESPRSALTLYDKDEKVIWSAP